MFLTGDSYAGLLVNIPFYSIGIENMKFITRFVRFFTITGIFNGFIISERCPSLIGHWTR